MRQATATLMVVAVGADEQAIRARAEALAALLAVESDVVAAGVVAVRDLVGSDEVPPAAAPVLTQPAVRVVYDGGLLPDLAVVCDPAYGDLNGWLVFRHRDGQWTTLADLKPHADALAEEDRSGPPLLRTWAARFLHSVGVDPARTHAPVVEEAGGDCLVKFMSDHGREDARQGAEFAAWLQAAGAPYVQRDARTFLVGAAALRAAGADLGEDR